MTAEVAILNKLAVALAADSAVTVGQGGESKKVFNTADKLFELSCKQPIACMIFSGGQFLQAPLPVLIKDFRSKDPDADKVSDVATALLAHFQTFAEASPIEVKTRLGWKPFAGNHSRPSRTWLSLCRSRTWLTSPKHSSIFRLCSAE